jgi:hypothetical protein
VAVREFIMPGTVRRSIEQAASATGFDYPSTLVGTSGKTTVYYATTLGTAGKTVATELLPLVDAAYRQMEAYFGISGQNVSVIIAPLSETEQNLGYGGAYHHGCDFSSGGVLYIDSTSRLPNAANVALALYIAELSECFMGAQNKGWNCGGSNGEGLSRVCATLATPNGSVSAGYNTAPAWVSANYPDWVTTTEPIDTNPVSTGCAVLYLYWMMSKGYSIEQLIQTGGTTLADNYKALTGKTTAYVDLKAAVQAVKVTTDNPFTLWHTIRHSDGSWQSTFGSVQDQEQNIPGAFSAVSCAGAGSSSVLGGQLHLVGIVGGRLWHTIREPGGNWQPTFGLIESHEQNNPGHFTAISCAGVSGQSALVNGQLHIVGIAGGQLWHTIRNSDGSWQSTFGLIESHEQNNPGTFTAISCATLGDQLHVVGVAGGQLWHTIRNSDGSWQSSFGLIESQEHNNPGSFVAVSCAGFGSSSPFGDGQLHIVGIAGGQLWHTIRNAAGNWQSTFELIESQEHNNPGAFTAISCAVVGNQLQIVGIAGGPLWHTIRNADGSWQSTFGLIESHEQNNPGAFTAVSCAGVGNELQLVGIT